MVRCRAYAKVNLCLAVSGPEPEGSFRPGWHKIASWFVPVALWDDIEIERSSVGSRYERAWASDAPRPTPIEWPEGSDLAVRAHRLLEEWAGRALPVRMRIAKRIPAGGGLGGGSSDAAAVLRGVSALYSLGIEPREMRSLSARLGSDVAYFIPVEGGDRGLDGAPAPALVRGFGDVIEPAAGYRGTIMLLVPGFGCATPEVYRALDALGPRPFREDRVVRMAREGIGAGGGAALFNDLLAPAEVVEPRLRIARRRLEESGCEAHLSGSGSTMFVLGEMSVPPPPGFVAVRAGPGVDAAAGQS